MALKPTELSKITWINIRERDYSNPYKVRKSLELTEGQRIKAIKEWGKHWDAPIELPK